MEVWRLSGSFLRNHTRGLAGRLQRAVEEKLHLKEAEHDPSEVLQMVREFSKEQAICEDDRRSNGRGRGKLILAGGGKLDGTRRINYTLSIPRKPLMKRYQI